jgi:hypothetical protein
VRSPVSAVARIVVLAVVLGFLAAFSCSGMLSARRPGRRVRPTDGPDTADGDGGTRRRGSQRGGARRDGAHRHRVTGGADEPGDRVESPTGFDGLFSPAERRELEAAFSEAHGEELAQLRERASEAAARLRSSAVPVHEVCSTGAGHRAETLRVCFADGTTVVLCCRGSSGSYWVQALRRQILLGSVVLDRMTFGLAGPVVVFGTPAGEVFVMADLVTIRS